MSDKEKTDMLIEQLAMLYKIEADIQGESDVLTLEINITEARLNALGVTDFEKLRPKHRK